MLCAKHHAIARTVDDHGWPLCCHCFTEAKAHAENVAMEDKIRRLWALQPPGWRGRP